MVITLDLEDYGSTIILIDRKRWGALPPCTEVPTKVLEQPVMFIHFTQTDTYNCNNSSECKKVLQNMQASHMEEGASDIKFNFLFGGYGTIYEGRGWSKGAYREGGEINSNCVDLAYIGKFNKNLKPKWDMVAAAIDFIKYGVKNKYISPNFVIV